MDIRYGELQQMSDEDLRDLNRVVCRIIRDRQYHAAHQFRVGDCAEFVDRSGITRKIKITGVRGRMVRGYELERPSATWRVGGCLLKHMNYRETYR